MLVNTLSTAIHLTALGERRFLTNYRSKGTSQGPSVGHRTHYFFHLDDIHHHDGIPGTAIQETPVGSLAHTFFAPDAKDGVHLDAAKRRMILIRHPKHAIFYGAIFHTSGRTRAPRAALGDDSKLFRFFLAGGRDSLRTRFVLPCVGDHSGDARGFGLGSHGRIIASQRGICNNRSDG